MKFFSLAGVLPPIIISVTSFIALGVTFPGYCDKGDGLWCTGSGLSGYAEYLFGGPFSSAGLLLVAPVAVLGLLLWGAWIATLFDSDGRGWKKVTMIYVGICALLAYAVVMNEWIPVLGENPDCIRGFFKQ